MLLSDLGEFGLIARIEGILSREEDQRAHRRGTRVLIGPGDDAAVVQVRGRTLLLTCDAAVEGRHFDLSLCTPQDAGYRAMAGAISDIAAMGGRPTFALVTLALRPDTEVEAAEGLVAGASEAAADYECVIVGGDCVRSADGIAIHVSVVGESIGDDLLLRGAARRGDHIIVTGPLGDSAAGLALLRAGEKAPHVSDAARAYLTRRHLRPEPRVRIGAGLAAIGACRCGIDVSDGLLQDLGHICEQSRVRATVRLADIPISSACREAAAALGVSAEAWALSGGEDYELLVTVRPDRAENVMRPLQWAAEGADDEEKASTLCPTIIGEISRGEGVVVVDEAGREVEPASRGWDHFRDARPEGGSSRG
jgi:thiamine-monophosphate kinase